VSALEFELPPGLEAHEPPEARGLTRDGVRLLVANRADNTIVHSRFGQLARFIRPGDLLVLNTSATLAAALEARRADGAAVELRLSTPAQNEDPDRLWIVELRRGDAPFADTKVGEQLALPENATATILAQYAGVRLWLARLDLPRSVEAYLGAHGRPIRYRYVPRPWPLTAYQNVYAAEPGSAEMASAGRPFTAELITRLVAGGVLIAPVTLHTGVSSQERGERPYPERYRVPVQTARLVNAVHDWGGRVIATGTTVVRALETVARPDGTVGAGEGWTSLVVTPDRGLWTVNGLLTGLHEPESSHLDILRAVAGEELLTRSFLAAVEHGYRWHEFGDSQLVLGAG
jgi:S-adenosylmethionine:tRNA ribosyltransferase-isomerase